MLVWLNSSEVAGRNKPLRSIAGSTSYRAAESSSISPHDVAMQRLYLVAGFLEPRGDLFGHHYAAVLAAGATKGRP